MSAQDVMNISSLDSGKLRGNLIGIAKHFDSDEAQNNKVSSMEKHVHSKKITEKIQRLGGANNVAVESYKSIVIDPESSDGSDFNK